MKTKYFIFAAAAALFAACSSDDAIVEQQVPQTVNDGAIQFSAYLNRGTTRAGAAGELVTKNPTTGQVALETTGFGVFGYYTDNELYSESSKPNFFYNQKVSTADWTYSPVKYWPNEFGSEAISEAQDKLTFFAYAPWVDVVPETGLLKEQRGENNSGIVALTRNTASGDPYVKYLVDLTPSNRVDLCWGVADENFTSSVVSGLNSITEGEVYKNVSKPEVNSKIKFDFNHALAALNVQIDADIDQDTHGANPLDATTKIYVRSVTFEGFAAKGMFNLNASKTTPKWYDLSGNNELTSGKVTIYDGRRDGSEGQVNASAANETPNDLNPEIIQTNGTTTGVPSSGDPVNLFKSTIATEPVYVIPVPDEQLKVTIVYDVETADPNLAGYLSDGTTKGSTIENSITKNITLTGTNSALKLAAGKKYKVTLHLGLTSVKFDASVSAWDSPEIEGEPWLPINNGSIQGSLVSATTTSQEYTFGGGTGKHTISSLKIDGGTEINDPDQIAEKKVAVSSSSTGTSGTLTFPENKSIYKKTYEVTIKDAATPTPNTKTITITQAAAPLGLSLGWTDATKILVTPPTGSDFILSAATVTIDKTPSGSSNVIHLSPKTNPATMGENDFYLGNNNILLSTAANTGDKFTVTIQAGDADAEPFDITY